MGLHWNSIARALDAIAALERRHPLRLALLELALVGLLCWAA